MHDQTLFFWGMVVTMFMIIAAVLTARELLDMYLEERDADRLKKSEETSTEKSTVA